VRRLVAAFEQIAGVTEEKEVYVLILRRNRGVLDSGDIPDCCGANFSLRVGKSLISGWIVFRNDAN